MLQPSPTSFRLQNQGPIFLTTADVNRDGKTDVIVAINPDTTSPQGTLLVYLGRGDGNFRCPQKQKHCIVHSCLGPGGTLTGTARWILQSI